MAFLITVVFLAALSAVACPFPRNTVGSVRKWSMADFESSGSGPDEPIRGIVKVVRLDPHQLAQSAPFRRGLGSRRAPSPGSRMPFPAFLARGRPGSASAPRAAASPLHHLRPERPSELELRKKQGVRMWQRAVDKGDRGGKMSTSLSISLKDTAKQTCTAVPFIQRVTAEGCDTITVHNKLCFGQCSSLFIPPGGELAGPSPGSGGGHRRGPCSRCAPSRAHTVVVPLRCGAEVRQRRVMLVEECKCETGREEGNAEAVSSSRL